MLVLAAVPPVQVTCLTPYTAQLELLRAAVPPGVVCSTVDSFQGQENTYIIISLGTACNIHTSYFSPLSVLGSCTV